MDARCHFVVCNVAHVFKLHTGHARAVRKELSQQFLLLAIV